MRGPASPVGRRGRGGLPRARRAGAERRGRRGRGRARDGWRRPWARSLPRGRRRACPLPRREEGQLELEAEATAADPRGIDADEAAGRGRERIPRPVAERHSAAVGRRTERGDDREPERVDALVDERTEVPPSLVERVEHGDPRERVAVDEGSEEPLHGLLVREAEQVAHARGRQPLAAAGEELVEHGFGVAHPAVRQARDKVDRVVVGLPPVGCEDRPELAADLRLGQPGEVESLEAREDGRPDPAGVGGAEDEDDVVGRLLERLEEDVPSLA